ncbi:MAG: NAD(P)H-hydrate dehydratase [Elusimicrobiota bacterium]
MKIITAREMSRLDKDSPVKAEILMERAGRGMANFIEEKFPELPVCFVCGSGNNGGDGLVAARYLDNRNVEVEIFAKSNLKGLAKKQAEKLRVPVKRLDKENLSYSLDRKKIVVDCLLGTGFSPPLRDPLKNILEIINKKSKIILACDIPTGVDGNTGEADNCGVRADCTVTFGYPKLGHYKFPGSEYTGSLENIDIGLGIYPDNYLENIEFITRRECDGYFSKRNRKTHKKDYGHVLIIGGSPGMDGAVLMAAKGALNTGAGLVTAGIPESLAASVSNNILSAMSLSLAEDKAGFLSLENFERIKKFIDQRGVDALVLGPGMGTEKSTRNLVYKLLQKIKKPVVIDADGLNNLAGNKKILKKRTNPTVITPHPGEMARLLDTNTEKLLENRIESAKNFSREYKCTTVLKGYRTVVTDGNMAFVNSTGNPGMATGGTGDILSGITGSLIGQGFKLMESCKMGVWIHGRAGDISAWHYGEKFTSPASLLNSLGNIY